MIVILGSSPNALIAAGYLNKGGHQVTVVEPSQRLGGPFESSSFSGMQGEQGHLSLALDPTVIRELELNLNVDVTHHKAALGPDGHWLRIHRDRLQGDVTERDAERWPSFVRLLDQAAKLLHASSLRHSNPSAQHALVEPWRALGERDSRETLRLPWMSLKDLLEEWFETKLLRGALAFIGLKGNLQGPFASGTVYGLLHQWSRGEALERHSCPRGVAGIVEQLIQQLRARGVEFKVGCPVEAVALEGDVAVGLRLTEGPALGAARVLCDYDAAYTFSRWIAPRHLETSFLLELHKMRYNGSVARLNLGVEALPAVPSFKIEDWQAGVILTPGLYAAERAYDPTKYGGFSSAPLFEAVLTQQNPLALSLWGQYYPYSSGESARGQLRSAFEQRFPEIKIGAEQELLPLDLEQRFGLTQGHLGGGDLSLNQTLFMRPTADYAPGHFPLQNFYLCGATTHPGGHSGLAGRLAAHECMQAIAFD